MEDFKKIKAVVKTIQISEGKYRIKVRDKNDKKGDNKEINYEENIK